MYHIFKCRTPNHKTCRRKPYDRGLSKNLLATPPKATSIKEQIDNSNFTKKKKSAVQQILLRE